MSALIVMGVSGSGKTTIAVALAKKLQWAFEDGDMFHSAANVEKMKSGHPLNDEDRWPWLRAIAAEIDRKKQLGQPIVIACSALKRAYRDILVHGARSTRIVYLRGDRKVIEQRLAVRTEHFMPPSLLDSQLQTLEEPGPDENPIVVDVDAGVDEIVSRIIELMG